MLEQRKPAIVTEVRTRQGLYARLQGVGTPVLFLHGTGSSSHSWLRVVNQLAAGYLCILPDLPGHGRSADVDGNLSIQGIAASVAALLSEHHLQPSYIVAHSSGCAVTVALELDFRVTPLANVFSAPVLKPFGGIQGRLFPLIAQVLAYAPFSPSVISQRAKDTKSVRQLLEGVGGDVSAECVSDYARLFADSDHLRGVLRMMAAWRLAELAPRLALSCVPTLMLAGEQDRAAPTAVVDWAAGQMCHARTTRIRCAGHLWHEQDAEACAALIERYFAGYAGEVGCESA